MSNTIASAERRGESKGRKDAKYEDALKMKAKGYPIAEITDITGLTAEEVERL